jgi:hypothetical protein
MSQKVNDDYPKKHTDMSNEELKAIATAQYEETPKAYDFPTEIVQLPSKGKLYPDGHPLKDGTIEMKYMTAKEEDILTNQSFIQNGVVLDKLFQSLIVTKVDYNDLLLCDKNAIMIAARVLGYGKDYPVTVTNPNTGEQVKHTVDLTTLEAKEIDWSTYKDGVNEFDFQLPVSQRKVKIRLLTQGIQRKIDSELKGLAKVKKEASLTTTLKYIIIEVDGDDSTAVIRKFVDNHLLAIDSRALRQYIKSITPDIVLEVDVPDGDSGDTFHCNVNVGLDLFWPDANL